MLGRLDVPMLVHLIDGTYELFRQHYGYARRQEKADGLRGHRRCADVDLAGH